MSIQFDGSYMIGSKAYNDSFEVTMHNFGTSAILKANISTYVPPTTVEEIIYSKEYLEFLENQKKLLNATEEVNEAESIEPVV